MCGSMGFAETHANATIYVRDASAPRPSTHEWDAESLGLGYEKHIGATTITTCRVQTAAANDDVMTLIENTYAECSMQQ